jgi:hypothetical protein
MRHRSGRVGLFTDTIGPSIAILVVEASGSAFARTAVALLPHTKGRKS